MVAAFVCRASVFVGLPPVVWRGILRYVREAQIAVYLIHAEKNENDTEIQNSDLVFRYSDWLITLITY